MPRKNTRLLLDEEPLQVLPSLASLVGINEAILLQQVHYWLKHAEKAREERKHRDGRWWTYNTYSEWQRQMPWLTVAGVRKLVYKLERAGLLISTDEYNDMKADQTKWYTIEYEELDVLTTDESAEEDSREEPDEAEENEADSGDSEGVPQSSRGGDTEGHPPATEGQGGCPEVAGGVPQSSRPLPENPENPENSPRGTGFPAKALTTLTIDRAREAGFEPAKHQIANWGRGWSEFAYVGEGEKPPDAEEQFAVLAEIVAAAAGNRGKGRFFMSVKDAVSRVRDAGRPKSQSGTPAPEISGEAGEARRKEGYEWLFDQDRSSRETEAEEDAGGQTEPEADEVERMRQVKLVEQHMRNWRSRMDDKGYQRQVFLLRDNAEANGITAEDVERLDEEIRADHDEREAG